MQTRYAYSLLVDEVYGSLLSPEQSCIQCCSPTFPQYTHHFASINYQEADLERVGRRQAIEGHVPLMPQQVVPATSAHVQMNMESICFSGPTFVHISTLICPT